MCCSAHGYGRDDIDLDVFDITSSLRRGSLNCDPSDRAAAMPRWSLNVLLRFLRSSSLDIGR